MDLTPTPTSTRPLSAWRASSSLALQRVDSWAIRNNSYVVAEARGRGHDHRRPALMPFGGPYLDQATIDQVRGVDHGRRLANN